MADRNEKGQFIQGNSYAMKPGETGRNPKGNPASRSIVGQLVKILDSERGEEIVDALVQTALKRALKGDFRFWNSILQYIDGKVPDRIAGHDGGPLKVDEETLARVQKIVDSADMVDESHT